TAERDGGQGGTVEAAHVVAWGGRRVGGGDRFHQYAHRRSRAAHDGNRANHRCGGEGRSRSVDGSGGGWAFTQRRVFAVGEAGQHDDRAALGFYFGGDARGARGRHRGQARRPGAGEGRVGRLEGAHRLGQPDGRQPDRAGA